MNWNGGYKNRFRPRSEVQSRKNTFQQQSRIVLVDNVGITELEQTSVEKSPIPNKLSTSPIVIKLALRIKFQNQLIFIIYADGSICQ